jgi:eukaryotic-like serine/threonine-protein kinase
MNSSFGASALQDLRILASVGLALCRSDYGCTSPAEDLRLVARHLQPQLHVGSRWGDLTLKARVACGSFGTVYRARDERLRVDVALKLPSTPLPDHQANVRLLQEARHLARVRHRGVVTLCGAATHGRRAGLWMELLHGRTLERILGADGPLNAIEVARIGCDLCGALDAIHAAGLVHGDIKPQNVIREDGGRVVLIDFGSVSEVSRPEQTPRRITGTPLYLAPELMADGAVSISSDIYSLGVLLFRLASRSYPVLGDSVEELAAAHRRRNVRRLRDLRPDLPHELCQMVDRALRFDPPARYQTAGGMQRALGRLAPPTMNRGSRNTAP